jgi:single-stranded-DNA-specific exonuclease
VTSEQAFLKVNRSFGGRRWIARPSDERTALALAQGYDLPELVGRVLSARGIDLSTADAFLTPKLKSLLPDPSHLKDMDAAASRIARAIMESERVAVFGDYDVDGATSSALLRRFFRAAGSDLTVYIPDRIVEGYGPNAPALLRLKAEGISLVVTVDCGVTSFDPLAAAADAGLEVVVIDHHAAEPRLPRAVAVVNPNRKDDASPHKTLAAVGVTYLLVVAVNRALRAAGWWNDRRPAPNLLNWLDIVALGTVCDVVPLIGLNRALVTQGLKIMAKRGNPGITALADLCKLNEKPDAWHAGFILGPRVNAGGRVGASDLGARMLSTDDPREAAEIARILDQHNTERRAIEAEVLEEAMIGVEAALEDLGGLVFAVGEGWHPGVIGIVAARLKERYNRAACVVALDNGIGKASGRSVRGVDLGAAVIAARHAGLLIAGGGHPMAAGFTASADRLPELKHFLASRIADQQVDGPLAPTLELDGMLSVGGATPDLVSLLARLGPFGTGNSEPRFALADARVVQASVVGENHVRCILSGQGGERLKAIAFRTLDTDLGTALLKSGGSPMHIAGHLRPDNWQGRNDVQLMIEDAAPVWGSG